jgi:signal peptidase I
MMGWLMAGLLATSAMTATLLARQRFFMVTVVGPSMLPTLPPGRRVLARRHRGGGVRVREVVVIERPPDGGTWAECDRRWMIKRVAAVAGDPVPEVVGVPGSVPAGFIVVLGDGQSSYDSRHFGLYPVERVLGVVSLAKDDE